LRLIDSCITQLKAQGPSRTCNESKEEEEVGGVAPDGGEDDDDRGRVHPPVSQRVDHNLPKRQFFIGNLLVRIHFIIVMIRWTGLAARRSPPSEEGSYLRLIDFWITQL